LVSQKKLKFVPNAAFTISRRAAVVFTPAPLVLVYLNSWMATMSGRSAWKIRNAGAS
jgi:hypothetical protein